MNKTKREDPHTLTILALLAGGSILFLRIFLPYIVPAWWSAFPARWKLVSGAVPFLILLLTGLWSLRRHRDEWDGIDDIPQRLQRLEGDLQKTTGQLQALFELNRLSFQAKDEKAIISGALKVAVELTNAQGASYVPLDKHAYPLESTIYGSQPTTDLKAWIEYLASPTVHNRCQACQKAAPMDPCPLLKDPFDQEFTLYCFPLRWGEHEFGVINTYLHKEASVDGETQRFVQMVADHLTLILESIHFEHRERQALDQVQDLDAESNLQQALEEELKHVQTLFETDFVSLTLQASPEKEFLNQLDTGALPQHMRCEVEDLVQKVLQTGEPLLLGNGNHSNSSKPPDVHSMMAAPLTSREQDVTGVLVVGKRGTQPFQPQQLTALQNMVQQFTRLIHNLHLMHELKYQTMLHERTRLAREIHDGLAQTLGFLKLQIAQIKRALERGEYEKLPSLTDKSHQVVSGAYDDAREAIDGLQLDPREKSFHTWLRQTISTFKESSDVEHTTLEIKHESDLPPEVQIQLIRIIQEALSNIRKHAQASEVEVCSTEKSRGVLIQIRDDGIGFVPAEVDKHLQHGIKGMRERAQLIGARFQIVSQPRQGTTILVHWAPSQKEHGDE